MYIVLAGFAVSCVVSLVSMMCAIFQLNTHFVRIILVSLLALADSATLANVQKESLVMAAECPRKHWRVQPKTSGKSQEEKAQINHNHCYLPAFYRNNVHESMFKDLLNTFVYSVLSVMVK